MVGGKATKSYNLPEVQEHKQDWLHSLPEILEQILTGPPESSSPLDKATEVRVTL